MGFGDWLSGIGGGISDMFSGGGGDVGGGSMPSGYSTYGISEAPLSVGGFGSEGAAGGGGFGSWLSGVGSGVQSGMSGLGDFAKAAAPFAQLGATGMGIAGGIQQMNQGAEQMKVLKQQQKQQQAMAVPAAASGGALTQAGSTALTGGALPPALEAQVESFKNEARMRYRQQLAAQGITDSSMAGQMESWIENQAQQLRGQLAGNLYGQGLSGIQAAMGPSAAVSQTAMGMAGGSQASLQSANAALSKLLGSQ